MSGLPPVPSPSTATPAIRWLSPLEKWGLWGLAALILGFGVLVELRGALMSRPMTDLQVFLRAAWAVRTGHDFYSITDDNGWHYHYPPVFAILLTPLADAPTGSPRAGLLPFAASVAIWYLLNVALTLLAIHLLASTLERVSANPAIRAQPVGCRRWWALRVLPLVACGPAIGHTLMRGQVNLILLALICAAVALLLRARPAWSGLCLAAAACVKIIPAFLLLAPLWRRDVRGLAGWVAGAGIFLVLVPVVVLGPARTAEQYHKLTEVLIKPGLGVGTDRTRARELTDMTGAHSQSFQGIYHNALHPDRTTQPKQAAPAVRLAHWASGGLLTLLTLLAAGWRRNLPGPDAALFVGALVVVMLLISPVCHPHYLCLELPLILALTAAALERPRGHGLRRWLGGLLLANLAVNILVALPAYARLRDAGLAGLMALPVWATGCVVLWQGRRAAGFPPADFLPNKTAGVNPAARAA